MIEDHIHNAVCYFTIHCHTLLITLNNHWGKIPLYRQILEAMKGFLHKLQYLRTLLHNLMDQVKTTTILHQKI